MAAVVLALASLGCPQGATPVRPPADAGLTAHPAAPPQISLNLPDGWVVATGADGVVRASSPRGQPVLRAELQRGLGLPTAATLRAGFLGGLQHLRERSESVAQQPGFIAVRFFLGEPDGGPVETEALLAATALGEDTLLCASLRGATAEELDVAQAACRSAGSAPGR
ncbi:MAG: hypothetical protein ACLPJH_04480 [Myxococcaceae bacterium]